MNADLTLVSGILSSIAMFFSTTFIILYTRRLNQKVEKFEDLADSVGALFRYEEDKDGQPLMDARLVKMVSLFSSAFASDIAKSLKFSLLGNLSGQARLEKGLKGAIASDVVENKMPLLNLIGDVLGFNTKKYIAKHPEAMLQVAQQFAPFLIKNNGFNRPQGELGKV